MATRSPARIVCPLSSVSSVAVRWKAMTGVAQRTISSAVVRGRVSLNSAHCSGWSTNAFMPWVVALRAVSLPAMVSRMTKKPNSSGVSDCPSMSAVTSVETRSSPGSARRVSAICQA